MHTTSLPPSKRMRAGEHQPTFALDILNCCSSEVQSARNLWEIGASGIGGNQVARAVCPR